MPRRLACFVLASALVLAVLPAAFTDAARPGVYPPGASLTVATDRSVYSPGATVTITATPCVDGALVTFTITPVSGGPSVTLTDVCDSPAVVTMPAGAVGVYTVVATTGGLSATTSFTVAALPATGGSGMSGTLVIAAIVLAIGIAMFLVSRTRRRSPSS